VKLSEITTAHAAAAHAVSEICTGKTLGPETPVEQRFPHTFRFWYTRVWL